MRVEVKQFTKDGFKREIKHIERVIIGIKNEIKILGNDTANEMKNIITQNKKRPQAGQPAKLEDAIDSTYIDIGEEFGFFVGLLDKLNKLAEHWHFINYGISLKGMRIPGRGKRVPQGNFAPGKAQPNSANFGEGRWIVGQGKFSFKAKKEIAPMHYIEKTAVWLDVQLGKILNKFK